MRLIFKTALLSGVGLGAYIFYTQIVANSRQTQRVSAGLVRWAATLPKVTQVELDQTEQRMRQRALLYERSIQNGFLADGMVVNRLLDGRMIDQCDSLLFSSLRFAALQKLGLKNEAETAWNSIRASSASGSWFRHPRCKRSTSRDMIVGLLVALSQSPEGSAEEIRSLFNVLRKGEGFFGDGPIYVSYLSPGLAEILRQFAVIYGMPRSDIPPVVDLGFSTLEYDTLFVGRGYGAHLIGLTAWLEIELARKHGSPVSFLSSLDGFNLLTRPFSPAHLGKQRIEWVAQTLLDRDPQNLFFRYLRLAAAGALTRESRHSLMTELLAMRQFPERHLPMNCDRDVDFLWQRDSAEYRTTTEQCTRQFAGVDLIWLSALLLDESHAAAFPATLAH